ncbi:hypothetical protein ACFL9U_02125 [Thermodesulfobacteriota bacterium]
MAIILCFPEINGVFQWIATIRGWVDVVLDRLGIKIISTIGLITINETLIVQLVSFLIFLFIINRVMFRPLRGVMAERDNYVQNVQSEILQAESELNNLAEELKHREATIKKGAFEIKEKLGESGTREATEIIAAVRKEIEAFSNAAKRDVDIQIAEAKKSIAKESETLAPRIMEKILERRLMP